MTRLCVRLQPRARRNEVVGERDGSVVVRVTAPPIGGRANQALVELLAARLEVPKSSVTIVRGETARDKVIEVADLGDDEVRRRLELSQ